MSGSSSSWPRETDEKINYTKLCRLLVDGGTQAVRSVFDGIHPPPKLKAILKTNKAKLETLRKPPTKVLNDDQWDKLYPPNGSHPKSKDFDITLLFVLLRNICGLTPPVYEITGSGKRKRDWNKLPLKTEISQEANLVRIKYYRNNALAHKPNTEINDADFEQHWQDISSALLSLGLSQDDIDELESDPLGKKDYNKLLHDWYASDEVIKTQLQVLKSDTAAIKSDTAAIKSDTAAIKSDSAAIMSDTAAITSDTAAIKSDTAGIKSEAAAIKSEAAAIKSHTEDIKLDTADLKSNTKDIKEKVDELHKAWEHSNLINKLCKDEFIGNIKLLCKSYDPNTRLWVLRQVESHVDSDQPDSCMMLITAGPGMGKSTIAAKICQMYKDLGCLAGCHFFQFSNSSRSNPRLMLQSIARQMCDTIPGLADVLESKLQTNHGKGIDDMNCEELFTVLLEEPCHKLKVKGSFVVVLDAIDECCSKFKHELQGVLKNKLSLLPSWLRFVITTRPPPSFNALQVKNSIFINPTDPENRRDIKIFFKTHLENDENQSMFIEQLVEVSGGLFLVGFFLIDEMQKKRISSPFELMVIFPHGLFSVYEKYFERLRTVLLPYITEEEGFFRMLEAVVASKDPIPMKMVYDILGLKNVSEVPHRERKARSDALSQLHSLFPVENDHVGVFHKSIVEFLIAEDKEQDFNTTVGKMSEKSVEKVSDEAEGLQDASEVSDSSSHVEGQSLTTENEKRDQNISLNTVIEEPPKDHDFSVHIDEGNKVLVDQCYDVLNDILNGKKDLNKPLDPTDSEKYALQFAWLPDTNTSLTKETNFQKLRNYLSFVACLCLNLFPRHMIQKDSKTQMFSAPLYDIIHQSTKFTYYAKHSKESCHFRSSPTFGCCIEMVLNAAYDRKVSEKEISPNPLTLLKEHNLSYFLREDIAVDSQEELEVFQAVPCQNGLALLLRNERNTEILRYQLDGTLLAKKSFLGKRKMFSSPDCHFIVVIKEMEKGEIEVIRATMLDLVSSFQSPNVIRSYHVYGDQPWYIVIRCYNNKIYVMEGETGHMSSAPIKVDQYVDVKAVSASGYVLLGTTWESTDSRNAEALFTDEDGMFLEVMNWPQIETLRRPPFKSRKNDLEFDYIIYCSLILFHLTEPGKRVPIYPRKTNHYTCVPWAQYDFNCEGLFSDDGKLLAFVYKGSIFVIQTSNNSIYRQVYLGPGFFPVGSKESLIYFSDPYVVMEKLGNIFFINIKTNEIEHRFLINNNNYFVVPRQQGEPFTLVSYGQTTCTLSKYEFHNLKY